MIDPSVKDFRLPMPTLKPFTACRSRVLVPLLGYFFLIVSLLVPAVGVQAATIVLDPGHGGRDGGAGRGNAYAEKQFTLALAQKIAALLGERHRVELTRTADIELSPADRAAVANHMQADLMVSLHAAVTPYCSERTAAVYYHSAERLAMPTGTSLQGALDQSETSRTEWNRLQLRHRQQSQAVATTIKGSIEGSGSFDQVAAASAPLVTLMGVDRPAILLEVGCIHPSVSLNPQTAEQQIRNYAEPIATAIEAAIDELEP